MGIYSRLQLTLLFHDLRWKPTGKVFKTVVLWRVPTGKIFTFRTTKIDSEPSHGSNEDIFNPHECIQNLDVSAGTLNLIVDTEAEIMTIPVALPEIALEAAKTTVVNLPTTTPDLDIVSDPKFEPSEALPFPDYVPSSPIHAPTSPDYQRGSHTKSEPIEDESEPIEDAPKAAEPLSA
nr:hypothetical protein [Tanacetum cinerariifolium]